MRFHRDEVPLTSRRSSFRETDLSQLSFAGMEAELRRMMDEDKDHTRGAELVAQMEEALNLVFDEISFEMGFNGEKHELILTPEETRSSCLSWSTSRSTHPGRCWSTGTSWWAVSPLRTPACAPRTAGTSPGRMCRSGWRRPLAAGDGPEILTLTGVFTGFVLLSRGRTRGSSSGTCRKSGDIPVEEYDAGGEKADDALGFEVGDMLAAVSLADCPIPGGEANAEKQLYVGGCGQSSQGAPRPIFWWRCWAPTPTPMTRGTSWQVLASYVLENDVELRDGETIGFTADDKHAITRSPGVGLPEEQMTLKISWRSGGDGPDEGGDDPDDGEDDVVEMDDGAFHLETIQEKSLPVDEINAYNHMAIYLRWCMEHEYLCPALRGHIQYFAASYSKSADHEGGLPSGWKARKCCGAT